MTYFNRLTNLFIDSELVPTAASICILSFIPMAASHRSARSGALWAERRYGPGELRMVAPGLGSDWY